MEEKNNRCGGGKRRRRKGENLGRKGGDLRSRSVGLGFEGEKVGVRGDFIEQKGWERGSFGTKVLSGSGTTFLFANKSRNILLLQSRPPDNIWG